MPESPVTSVEHLPQAVVVHVLATELRKSEVDALCAAIDNARVVAPSLPFILDMARVTFAGSVALGVLVGLSQEFRSRERRLIFVNLQTNVRNRSRSAASTGSGDHAGRARGPAQTSRAD